MGKKDKYVHKKGSNQLQPITRNVKVNLHKFLHGVQFKKKAPKAIRIIKDLVRKQMFTKDVRIDPELNRQIWRNGIRNLPVRIEICMDRRKNEDEEEGQESLYTLVKYVQPTVSEQK